jgi:hypothetical protein
MRLACIGEKAGIAAGFPEMSLAEALADPLIRAMMAADGVDPARLAHELAETARRVGRTKHVPAKACPRPDRGWTPVRRQEHASNRDNVA